MLRAPLQRPLPGGSQITINVALVIEDTDVCVQAYMGSSLGFSGQLFDVGAAASGGSGSYVTMTTAKPTAAVPELVFAVVSSDQFAGNPQVPATLLSPPITEYPAWLGVAAYTYGGGGTAGITFYGGLQQEFVGLLEALYADDIFGNGFD